MQDATENRHYTEIVREPLRLELNFTFPQKHGTSSLFWGNDCLWFQLTSLVLLEKRSKNDDFSLQQLLSRMPLLKL